MTTTKRIRLELARDHEFPEGSVDRGYEFLAPLETDGHLSASEWKKSRNKFQVKRFRPGELTQFGRLVHKPGGTWAFDYNPDTDSDDEPGFKLGSHRFVNGEYVSVKEHDGVMRTFRIAEVADID